MGVVRRTRGQGVAEEKEARTGEDAQHLPHEVFLPTVSRVDSCGSSGHAPLGLSSCAFQ